LKLHEKRVKLLLAAPML